MSDQPIRRRQLHADKLYEALIDAGIVRRGERIRRVVIDARAGYPVIMHVERITDDRLLDVVATLDGIDIHCQGGPDQVRIDGDDLPGEVTG